MALSDAVPFAVIHWPLDESSAGTSQVDRIDSLVGNDLVDDSGFVASTTGKFGNAADFEASNSEYLHMGDTADVSVGDIKFMWRLWFRAETLASFPVLFSKGDAGDAREYILFYDTSVNLLTWTVRGSGTTTNVQWGSALSTGTDYLCHVWHDSDANQIGISVNAGTAVTASHSGGVQDLDGNFNLGSSPGQSLYWDGWIDDVVLLKGYILDATERSADYNGGTGVAFADWDEAAGITQTVNQVTETDSAQPVSWSPKRRLVNAVSEADLSQSLTRRKSLTLGQCSETDLAQTLSRLKRITLGLTSETDLAQALTRLKSKVLGLNSETDSAQPVDWNPARRLVNQTTETDLAQSIAGVTGNTVVVNQVTETDLAQALSRLKVKALGMCNETDLAQALQGLKTRLLGSVTETDSAQTVNRIKTFTLGLSQETDLAQTLRLSPFARLIVQVIETDSAVAITAIGGDTVLGPYYVDKQSWFGPGPVKMLAHIPGAVVGAYQ